MKKIILYGLLTAGLLAIPVKRADVGNLRPVEVVLIYQEDNQICMRTDTDDGGSGENIHKALQNMLDASLGVIYLDTAKYLLLTDEVQDVAQEMRTYLDADVQLCVTEPGVDLKMMAQYLGVHGKLPQLGSWKPGQVLPLVTIGNGKIKMS